MDEIEKTKVAEEVMNKDSELGNIDSHHGCQDSLPETDQQKTLHSTEQSTSTGGTTDKKKGCRLYQDWLVLCLGMVFMGAIIAAMFGLGSWRQWNAPSGYSHNESSNYLRFLPEPCECGYDPYPDVKGRVGRTDAASQWYYWRLKPEDVTIWNTVFIWICYGSHQISIWVVIYVAQCQKNLRGGPRASNTLDKFNWISFGINVFFHIIHLVHTHILYNGMAPDVTLTSSQSSVIMLAQLVLIMEYNERGLFFGWPVAKQSKSKISQKLRLNMKPIYLIRKYHAYAITWAIISTFWYHPMENTMGHALGFLYTWLFLIQGSLMFTKVHVNAWWRLLLEGWVIVHGALVALQTQNNWPMFFFGFFIVFCLSQIYILPFWYKIHIGFRVLPPVVLIASLFGVYSQHPDEQGILWRRMPEVLSIPAIYYLGFILVWAFLYACVLIDNKIYANRSREPTTAKKALYLIFSLVIYVAFVVTSTLLETYAVSFPMLAGMGFYFALFSFGSALVCLLMSHTVPKFRLSKKATKALENNAWEEEPEATDEADELPIKIELKPEISDEKPSTKM